MFTQNISMDCTQEQYEKFLKDELLRMGYEEVSISAWKDSGNCYVSNCWNKGQGIGNINKVSVHKYNYIGSFNAPLFLALAAMTDGLEGGYGEWITYDGPINTYQRKFKQLSREGQSYNNAWRKATVSEIAEKFGEKPPIETDLDKLAARVEKLEKKEKERNTYAFLYEECGIIPKHILEAITEPHYFKGAVFANPITAQIKVGNVLEEPLSAIPQTVPYQLCPKCGGLGMADVYHPIYGFTMGTCDLCKGEKVIPMHVINK